MRWHECGDTTYGVWLRLCYVVDAQRSSSRPLGYHLGMRYEKKNSHEALIWAARLRYLSSPNALERSTISFIVPNLHLHSGRPSGDTPLRNTWLRLKEMFATQTQRTTRSMGHRVHERT
jgi:hypothetical protein